MLLLVVISLYQSSRMAVSSQGRSTWLFPLARVRGVCGAHQDIPIRQWAMHSFGSLSRAFSALRRPVLSNVSVRRMASVSPACDHLLSAISPSVKQLENHPLYGEITSMENLRFFMERHVYAVFDFMSLTKRLQREFAPIDMVWVPPPNPDMARFVNEIILAEESDETPDGRFISHFAMYCEAMEEVQAQSAPAKAFVALAQSKDIDTAFAQTKGIPNSARTFSQGTFGLLKTGGIHEIAASFCFGREKIIPSMFQQLIDQMSITDKQAPMFHFYLERHIEVDGDSHGPLALQLISNLCQDDPQKWKEAERAAEGAIQSRIAFWDDVREEMKCL